MLLIFNYAETITLTVIVTLLAGAIIDLLFGLSFIPFLAFGNYTPVSTERIFYFILFFLEKF